MYIYLHIYIHVYICIYVLMYICIFGKLDENICQNGKVNKDNTGEIEDKKWFILS